MVVQLLLVVETRRSTPTAANTDAANKAYADTVASDAQSAAEATAAAALSTAIAGIEANINQVTVQLQT